MRRRTKAVHPTLLELMVEEETPTLKELAVALRLPKTTVQQLANLPADRPLELCPDCHQRLPGTRRLRRSDVDA